MKDPCPHCAPGTVCRTPVCGRLTADAAEVLLAPKYTGQPASIDFESDAPLVCSRDQSGDTTCEACQ